MIEHSACSLIPAFLSHYRGHYQGTKAVFAGIDPAANLREVMDIDSMDFLNFITAIHHRLGIDIPEIDYPKLVTLDGAVAYLGTKLESSKT